ncbi:TMEM175 family protein [Cryobacterium arcticum]|nr:TMEM175 family protein [Cryobacterium arcticum]
MESARARYRRLLDTGRSTERLEFFSDAVFAIAMTLLVLDIRLPDTTAADLGRALANLAPEYFAYALSFVVIALNWAGHHRKFRLITGYDRRLVQLNLLLLLLVAFLPFPTSVLSEYAQTPAVVLYAATVAAISGVQCLIWLAARASGLLDAAVDRPLFFYVLRLMLVTVVVFTASIPVAVLGSADWALYSWILALPLTIAAARWAPSPSPSG